MSSICTVILAAGLGRRFQHASGSTGSKLLAECAGLDGERRPVLEHVLLAARTLESPRVLVTRPDNQQVVELGLRHGCQVVLLASDGMGDSLAAAIKAVPNASGWLIVLGDMPFVRSHTLLAVQAAMRPESICVPVGEKGHGHPVGFGRAFGEALQRLAGDQGARRLFREADVIEIQTDDPGIYLDVDVPPDLDKKP